MNAPPGRFTLIELLVVIAIIARPDRAAAARRPGRPRGGPAGAVRRTTSSRSAWPCTTTTRLVRRLPGRVPLPDRARPGRRPRRSSTAGRRWPRWPRSWSRRTWRNALNFDFPLGYRPTGGRLGVLAALPGQHDGDGRDGRHLPLPERRRPAAAGRLGADQLRLLRRRRAPTAATPPAPTARSSSARAISMADVARRLERHRRRLRAAARDRRPVVHPDLAHAGPLAPWPGRWPTSPPPR